VLSPSTLFVGGDKMQQTVSSKTSSFRLIIEDASKVKRDIEDAKFNTRLIQLNASYKASAIIAKAEAKAQAKTAKAEAKAQAKAKDFDEECSRWSYENIKGFCETLLQRSFIGLFSVDSVKAELNWICSDHFDSVCRALGLDSNVIRVNIPRILRSEYHSLDSESKCIINDFKQLKDIIYLKNEPRFERNDIQIESTLINNYLNSEDFDFINACIEDVNRCVDVKCKMKPIPNKEEYTPYGAI